MPPSAASSPDLLATLKPSRKLSLLIQNSPLAIVEWDSDLVVQSWNPAAAELFNFFEDEAIGQRLDQLLEERQIANLGKEDWQSCEPSGVLRSHVNMTGKKLCRWFNTPFLAKGQRVGTLTTIIDVTHQTALSNEELRSQLQSRTRVLKHATERLQLAMSERTQTDAALQAAQTRFDNFANNIPGALYQFCLRADGHQHFPYISEVCKDICELDASQLNENAAALLDLLDANGRLSVEISMRQSLEDMSVWTVESQMTTASGQRKWIQMSAKPQRMSNGSILWSGMMLDITDRKRTEAQLQATQSFFENLFNAFSDPLFVKDENHTLTLCNDAFCQFVGRSKSDLIGKSSSDLFITNNSGSEAAQASQTLSAEFSSSKRETYFTDANGKTKYISITRTLFSDAKQRPHLLGFVQDITQQSIAQKALKESEKQLKKLAANLPGMLYQFCLSTDLKPSFPFVSPSSETLLELSPKQIIADSNILIDCIHSEDRAEFDRSVARSAQNLTDWQWRGRFVLPSQRTVWAQAVSRPERRADGSILWDGILIDITDSKEAEAALQHSEAQLRSQTQQLKTTLKQLRLTQSKLVQSEKMSSLGQLVAGIAHEINNPINFIHGNLTHAQGYIQDMLKIIRLYQAHYPTPISEVQTVSDEIELDYVLSDLPKLLQSVQAGANRIRQIVLSLRNFSRLDESELKRADIHEGIESTLMILGSRLKATASRHAIEVVKAYENIPLVECYVGQLNQVFMNILANAIDAIDGTSEVDKIYQIVLQTFQREDRVVIQITNNGPPIPQEIAQRMFDPFFTTKPVGQGTGMGLAISYQTIVELHQGSLEHSRTADQKTVFTIEIPLKINGKETISKTVCA